MFINENSLNNVSLAKKEKHVSLAKIEPICGGVKQTKADRMNALVKSVRSGDIESFDELYTLATPKAISIAMSRGATQDQASDIAQEAMMRLYRDIDKVDSVSSWLSVVVSHMVIDASRKKSNYYEVYELDAPMDDCMGDSNSKQRSEMVADMRIEANPEALPGDGERDDSFF